MYEKKLRLCIFDSNSRNVLDVFLKELVVSGVTDASEQKDTGKLNTLIVEQVKVVDNEGNLKLVYPSRADLNVKEHSVAIVRE